MIRVRIYVSILFLCLAVLLSGLVHIQVIKHEKYRVMSEDNRLKVVPLMAPRGSILDRHGNALVKDVLSFNVAVVHSRIKDKADLSGFLCSVLGVTEDEMLRKITEARRTPFSHVCVASDVGIEKAILVEEGGMDYPGLFMDVTTRREYVYGKISSNVLGYIGYINRPEFERMKHYGYRIDDLMGRDGIEKYYDDYLRGRHGGKQIEVDHRGRESTILGFKEPVPGKNVYLTIDLKLQEFCDGLLEGKKGVIVVMDPNSGAILAMANAPSYDPGIFIDRARRKERSRIFKDENSPLLNRAIAGVYPLGSVFKVVTAMAALETGKVTPFTSFECPGYFYLGKTRFNCWNRTGHGIQALTEALKNSCNVYFFNIGLLAGVDKIAEFAEKCGFGRATGIDLPGENPGVAPGRAWKKKRLNENWYNGDTVNYAIGQGYFLCTPVQAARLMSIFANGGYLVRPFIAEKIDDITVSGDEKVDIKVSAGTLENIREGLRKAVNDARGTGQKARLPGIVVAGKTGTAQTSRGISHGWFAGFAPFDKPALTVMVFDEYGGKGGYYAAETAGKVFQKAQDLGLL
ncbi:MAG: penicillin-binding protein 2 [Candidatus Omnitrophota bacterium]